MELWLAALLLLIFAGGFTALLFLSVRKKNKARLIAIAGVMGTILLALMIYIVLTFVLVKGIIYWCSAA